jgi:hypothetical protein
MNVFFIEEPRARALQGRRQRAAVGTGSKQGAVGLTPVNVGLFVGAVISLKHPRCSRMQYEWVVLSRRRRQGRRCRNGGNTRGVCRRGG